MVEIGAQVYIVFPLQQITYSEAFLMKHQFVGEDYFDKRKKEAGNKAIKVHGK